MRTPVAGGEPTLLADAVRIDDYRLIVAGAAVYWLDSSVGIMKVAAGGGAVTPVVQGKILPGFQVVGDSIYFWELTATDGGRPARAALTRRPLAGGPPITIATSDDSNALASNQVSLVVDGDSVYWNAGDTISKTSTDGSGTTRIASGLWDISLVASDATELYYLGYGSLFAVPK
jgi:hypothetical protein